MSARVAISALAVLFTPGFDSAQTTAPAGKMSFDVASIRLSKPGTFTPPGFALDEGDSYAPFPDPHGLFTADFALPVYIGFAYKLWLTPEQRESMLAHLPKWVSTDHFEIHAKAEGDPTKDQMRLMLQSLLADRFQLAVHFEARETRVFALMLAKAGTTGPGLRPHAEGPPCDATIPARGPVPASAGVAGKVFPPVCGTFMMNLGANQKVLVGSRNATMKQIADSFASAAHRPVVDQTGLNGRFDFRLEWTPESNSAAAPGAPADSQAVTFEEALLDQLGVKLKPATATIKVLVIDRVEKPSEN